MSNLVEARREARRRRILENSAKRMDKIFDVEQKRDPGLEDGPLPTFKMAAQLQQGADAPADQHDTAKDNGGRKEEPAGKHGHMAKRMEGDDLGGLPVHTWNDSAAPTGANSPYHKPRILVALALGAIAAALLHVLHASVNVLLPWLAYEMCMEMLLYYVRHFILHSGWRLSFNGYTQAPTYPSHGHLVNILLFAGVHPRIVRLAGRAAECGTRVAHDTLAMLCAFVAVVALAQILL